MKYSLPNARLGEQDLAGKSAIVTEASLNRISSLQDEVNSLFEESNNPKLDPPRIIGVVAPLTEPTRCSENILAAVKENLDAKVNILVQNAALQETMPIEAVDDHHVRRMLTGNVTTAVMLVQALLPHFTPDSRIVNISSEAARQNQPAGVALVYAATKAALESMTRVWADALGTRSGMERTTVNSVIVGITKTGDTPNGLPEGLPDIEPCLGYWLLRIIYRVTLHPYAKYPGPRFAAISDLWYAYHWLTGRWPWAVEGAFRKHGDIVRIAPNEIAIFGYKAIVDVLTPGRMDDSKAFLKTEELGALAGKHKGFAADTDPKIHRNIRKILEASFSVNAIKEWQEPILHKHFDLFIHMVEEASKRGAINLTEWTEWLSIDLAGDLTFGHDYGNVKNGKAGDFLEIFSKLSFWGTVNQVSARFPILYPFILIVMSPGLAKIAPKLQRINSEYISNRIRNRDKLAHEDFMSPLIPKEGQTPEVDYLVAQSLNIVIDVQNIVWLNAVVNEGLRLATQGTSGLPRISPGAIVDGHFVPKGYRVQTSFWAVFHSERYFAKPREFWPERWLPKDHPDYDNTFANDQLTVYQPFSLGTRGCIGRKTGLVQAQLMLAKLLWALDWEHCNQDKVD
ncbi:hypothetical protein PspLS_11644 [Pyricularia sp. CBS 133598]|nr:hypothetical protein PspLS_11644 [Pyricularia sp. CBS 133598]